MTAITSAFVVRNQAEQDAKATAREEAQFAADLAATDIAAALTQLQGTVSSTAKNPAIASLFDPGSPCNVTFAATDVFQKTHLEFIRPNGTISCSSAGPTPAGISYDVSYWLPQALQGPVLIAPILDARTGRASVVSAAPVGVRGVVAGFADLTELGTTLATRLAGPRQLEFLVTTADGKTALARSLEPARWSGAPIGESDFVKTGGSTRVDLNNTTRVYGAATAGTSGWQVFAGAEESAVVATAVNLFLRELSVMSVGLIAVLLGTLFVYRRVVGPIHALSRSVGGVRDPAVVDPVIVSGPSEIARLAENFNGLLATVKEQLAEHRRDEANARAMLNASISAIVGMDGDGKIVEWNRQAEATFGWAREEVMGQPLVSLIVPERYRARHDAGLAEYRRTGVGPVLGKRLELEAVTRDGREIAVELSITPAETPTGHLFTAFISDITERKTAEEQRLTLEERLRQSERLEGIGRLAGGIAHDFNNILAVVMNYSQFVEDTLPADSPVRDDVVQIRLAAERGATFTRQLLTFAHRGAVNPQDVHLNTVLTDIRTMLRRTIPKSVAIDLQLAPDLWTIEIDVGQLEQLLLNLIMNAADAMPDGGTALIQTTNVEFNGDVPAGLTSGRHVRLDVTDTGYGMSKDVIARAFEPFFTTKPKGKGTGLGLATAYGIVQQAHGAISIQSVVGRGTSVHVHIPARVGVQPELHTIRTAAAPQPVQSAAMILVVEDEAAVRKSVVRILTDRGYSVLQAPEPKVAIELGTMWVGPVDLLLTDIVMPEMSGDELARELRKARPHLRVVYMTGYSGGLDTATLRIDGAIVQKPFTRDSLLVAVEKALAGNV